VFGLTVPPKAAAESSGYVRVRLPPRGCGALDRAVGFIQGTSNPQRTGPPPCCFLCLLPQGTFRASSFPRTSL